MAKEGYVIFVFRLRPRRGGPDADPRPLDDLDGNGLDLLDEVARHLADLSGRPLPEREARYENAYSFTGYASADHDVFVEGEAGPYGATGRMRNLDDGTHSAFAHNEAAMVPINGMVVRWPDTREGLLFSEKRSTRTLRKPVELSILKQIAREQGLILDIWAHVDPAAWEAFLNDALVTEVKAVYRSTREEDYRADMRSRPNLSISAEGHLAQRLGTGMLRGALARLRRRRDDETGEPEQVHHVEDASSILVGDLKPRADDSFAKERVTIKAVSGKDSRTIEIEAGELPQWTYRTEERLTPAQAKMTWRVDATKILRAIAVHVPAEWQDADQR